MPSQCGCEILDAAGNPVTWADAGLSLAQTEIRERGWDNEREGLENDLCLTNHFAVGSPTMQDDEFTRVHTMDVLSPYIKAPDFSEFHQDSMKNFNPDRCYSSNEISALISEDGHTGCNPRAVSMLASGSEEFSGSTQYIVIEEARQCILKYRGKLRGQFRSYLQALVRALPRAAMKIREWNNFVTMQMNGWNVSETGDKALSYNIGFMNSIPDAVVGIATLRDFERHLRLNDFSATKTWHVDERVFRSMLLFRQFNGAQGFELQATTFMGPQLPNYTIGSTVNIDGVSFKVCDLPVGYIRQSGPLLREFIPVDPRQWRAVNRGVRAFGDSRYHGPQFTDDNGVVHELISPLWAADPKAYLMRPFGLDASTPVTSGAEAWSAASKVMFVGGADLPCNVDRTDFQPRFKQAWKMDPVNPRAAGVVWSRLPGEQRIANRLGLDSYASVPAVPVTLHPGCEVDGLTCPEKLACAVDPAPLPSVVGVLRTECRVSVEAGTLLLKLCVTRDAPVGYNAAGAVSLDWATAAGTATAGAGNEFTAASGTLNWADGECGPKCFEITLLATASPDTQFNVNYSNVTPAEDSAELMPNTTCTSTVVAFPAVEV